MLEIEGVQLQGLFRGDNRRERPYQQGSSCGPVPPFRAELAGELRAILDISTIAPHPQEFGVQKVAKSCGGRGARGRNHNHNCRGPGGHVRRQRDAQFPAGWNVRIKGHRFYHTCLASASALPKPLRVHNDPYRGYSGFTPGRRNLLRLTGWKSGHSQWSPDRSSSLEGEGVACWNS